MGRFHVPPLLWLPNVVNLEYGYLLLRTLGEVGAGNRKSVVKAVKARRKLEGPPPERIWSIISDLAKSAYYYELAIKDELPAVIDIDLRRVKARINALIDLEKTLPITVNTLQAPMLIAESSLAKCLHKVYAWTAKTNPSMEVIHQMLIERLPSRFKKNAATFVLTKDQIQIQRGGARGGAKEAALEMAGKYLFEGGRTKMGTILKLSDSLFENDEELKALLRNIQKLEYDFPDRAIKMLNLKSDREVIVSMLAKALGPKKII